MTNLILIRHGETDWNAERRIQGQLDIPLSAVGVAQAEAVGRSFRDRPVDVLISSDLSRAMQTMAPIAEHRDLDVSPDPRLRERHHGVLQGLTSEEALRAAPQALEVLRTRIADAVLEAGESLRVFADRVTAALGEIANAHRNKRVVIVTHGGVLDIAYRKATAMPLEAPRNFPIPNTSVSSFRVDDAGFHLIDWADLSHLPPGLALDEL